MTPKEVMKEAQKLVAEFNRNIMEFQGEHSVVIMFDGEQEHVGIREIRIVDKRRI